MERLWSQSCEQSHGSLVCSSFTGPFISVFAPTCCPSPALGAAVCEWKHCAHRVFPPSALEAPAASLLVLQPTERLCGMCLLVPKHELARKEGSPSRPEKPGPPTILGALGRLSQGYFWSVCVWILRCAMWV